MSTFVNATTANRNAGTSQGVGSYPSGWADGDYLLAFLTSDASVTTDDVTSAPAGWTKLSGPDDAVTGTIDERLWCYGKFAATADSTTPTWTFSAGEDGQINIVCIRGVDGTTPVNAIGFLGTASGAGHISAAINVTASAGMLVSFAGYDGGSVVTADPLVPPGTMTQAAEGGESSSGTYSASAYETFASALGSITRTWTLGAGVVDDSVGVYLVALADGTGGGAADPAQNANFSAEVDTEFALRFEIQEAGGASSSLPGLHLYAQKNLTGGYSRVQTSSTGLKITATSRFTDAAATTDLLTAGTGTFVAGEGDENGAVGAITLGASGHTEVEFALTIASSEATIGDFWDLRVYKSDGSQLDTYTVTPRVTAAAPPATDPTISANPTSLAFTAAVGGGNPATKNLVISNTGGGTLSFTVSDDAAWLSVAPTSGTAPQTLVVSATTGALTEGPYSGTITITDSGGTATNNPLTVPVTFTISATGTFPVDTGGVWGETSNQVAPILAPNGALYIFNEQPATTTNSPGAMRKSTDGGSSWTEMDQLPDSFPGDHESTSLRLDGTDIHIVWQRSSYYVYRHLYDTTTDTYSTVNEVVQGSSRSATDQCCTAAHRSDGTTVAVYTLNATQLCYRIRSAAGTWGSEVVLDSEASQDFSQAFVMKSAIGDVVHIAYYNVAAGILYYRSLSAADVLSSRTSIATGLYSGTSNTFRKAMPNDGLVVWNNAGADRMYVAYRKVDGKLYGKQLDGTTPTVGSEEAISSGFVFCSPAGIQSFQMVGAVAVDSATGIVYALWSDAPSSAGGSQVGGNQMLWRVRSAAGTWNTESNPHNSEPIAAIAASVNTISSTKYVTVFYDEFTGVDPGISKFTRFAATAGAASFPLARRPFVISSLYSR